MAVTVYLWSRGESRAIRGTQVRRLAYIESCVAGGRTCPLRGHLVHRSAQRLAPRQRDIVINIQGSCITRVSFASNPSAVFMFRSFLFIFLGFGFVLAPSKMKTDENATAH